MHVGSRNWLRRCRRPCDLPVQPGRIMVATKPIDFRKGHDGLAALVKNELHKDPFTGTIFVFRSRRADRLKLLYWASHCRAIGPRDNGARRVW